jgi:hypothetical protein
LLGKASGFKAHNALSVLSVINNGFCEFNLWAFHGPSSLFFARKKPIMQFALFCRALEAITRLQLKCWPSVKISGA